MDDFEGQYNNLVIYPEFHNKLTCTFSGIYLLRGNFYGR